METILDQVLSYILNIDKRTYWGFLISSGVISYVIFKTQRKHISFFYYLFNKKIWLGKSAFIDYIFIFFNAYLKLVLLSTFAIYGLRFAYEVTYTT